MSYKITATAPTGYQYSSLNRFNMTIKKNGNGSFTAMQEFESEDEAKEYLRIRANRYNEQDPNDRELAEMYADIELGALTLDAVTAHIEEIEETEE